MNRSAIMASRLREVFLNGYWIANTNYKEQLLALNQEQATRKVDSLNTIAALTFHINYYLSGILQVFRGATLDISDQYSFDAPAIHTETDWQQLVRDFLNNAENFAVYVEQMSDVQLEEVFVDEKYGTYYRNIEGMIEHSYYHLGQITLIKKMILQP